MITTASEFLEEPELAAMTGRARASEQIKWLESRGWVFEVNAAKRPVVGRLYTRLKLSGVDPSAEAASAEPWTLDLSRVE